MRGCDVPNAWNMALFPAVKFLWRKWKNISFSRVNDTYAVSHFRTISETVQFIAWRNLSNIYCIDKCGTYIIENRCCWASWVRSNMTDEGLNSHKGGYWKMAWIGVPVSRCGREIFKLTDVYWGRFVRVIFWMEEALTRIWWLRILCNWG